MNDIYLYIFKLLEIKDIPYVSQVCKEFYCITQSNILWYYFYNQYYKDEELLDTYCNTCKMYYCMMKLPKTFYELPKNIKQMQNIQALNNTNNISFIPTELSLLTNLVNIVLSGYRISIIPTQIGLLTNLHTLGLSDNNITEIPTEIGMLTNLNYLGFANNKISIIPTEIGLLTKLAHLRVNNNYITYIPMEIKLSKNIKTFNFNNWSDNDIYLLK